MRENADASIDEVRRVFFPDLCNSVCRAKFNCYIRDVPLASTPTNSNKDTEVLEVSLAAFQVTISLATSLSDPYLKAL